MGIIGLMIIILGTASAVWVLSRGQGGGTSGYTFPLLRSLGLGVVVLILGAVPWIYAEMSSPPEQGAAFIFLFWIIFGPVISFGVMPGVYVLVTLLKLPVGVKTYGLPALLAILVTFYSIYIGFSTPSLDARLQTLIFALLFDVTAFACWLIYFRGMEKEREHPGA